MKKDSTRDYATEMFREYAAHGMISYEEARERIYQRELEKRARLEPEEAVVQAQTATKKQMPLLLDILAADKALELLEKGGKGIIVQAVKAVYFIDPAKQLRSGDITARVRRFSLQCPANESTVYRWLKEARLLCAALRGLNIANGDLKKYHIVL